jgi:putative Mg2+ transporter-C (MgtC) family protein
VSADATRIASNIITGISFLGAGMIFVKGANIKGLTTAAGIWATAAVSMAIGSGLYFTGIVSTVIIVVIQVLFHTFLIGFDKVLSTDKTTEIIIRLKNSTELVNEIKAVLSDNGFIIQDGKTQLEIDGTLTLILNLKGEKNASIDEAMMLINKEDVKYVSFN